MTSVPFQMPAPLNPVALIDAADHSINNPPPGLSPSRETIHRSVSTAYYAVFHAITRSNADALHGPPTSPASAQSWTATYRSMRHGAASSNLQTHLFHFQHDGRILASHFISLKDARETADYDPNFNMTSAHAANWISDARDALLALQAMSPHEKLALANITLRGHP